MDEERLDRPRLPRGGARGALLAAAADLLEEATLDDLTAFVTVSRLRSRTGLSSGAIYSAFSPTSGVGTRSRSAPQSVARQAFLDRLTGPDGIAAGAVGELGDVVAGLESQPDQLLIESLAELVAVHIESGARGELSWDYSQTWLAAALALNDAEVAQSIRTMYSRIDRDYAVLLARLLELTGRELLDGIDPDRLATLMVGAADGIAIRLRLDDALDERVVSQVVVALWIGLTRRAGEHDEAIGHRVAVRTAEPLDQDEQDRVLAAVRRVHDRAGWPAVTLRKVAQLAGMADARLAGRYPTRDHLAQLVWEGLVAATERRAASRRQLPGPEQVDELVRDLAEVACSERALVASLCIARLRSASDVDDPATADPTDRLVVLLADRLSGSGADLAGGSDGTDGPDAPSRHASASRIAGLTVDGLLMRAASSSIAADELADVVLAGLGGLDGLDGTAQ